MIQESKVPCGKCTACCQNDMIVIRPEHGDDPSQYITTRKVGHIILQSKPDGDCIYLDRKTGCTIHDRRPATCRNMDCRNLILLPPHILKATVSPAVIKAGKKQLKAAIRKSRNLERLCKMKEAE